MTLIALALLSCSTVMTTDIAANSGSAPGQDQNRAGGRSRLSVSQAQKECTVLTFQIILDYTFKRGWIKEVMSNELCRGVFIILFIFYLFYRYVLLDLLLDFILFTSLSSYLKTHQEGTYRSTMTQMYKIHFKKYDWHEWLVISNSTGHQYCVGIAYLSFGII